jgi:hypothetical protein
MDPTRRSQLIKRRAITKASHTRMQNFIEADDRKRNEIQTRFDELPNILNKYDIARNELEIFNDTDHSDDRQQSETQ